MRSFLPELTAIGKPMCKPALAVFCFLQLFQLKRARIELVIGASPGNQLFMTSLLYDPAMVKHEYLIARLDSGESVRNDKRRAALHELIRPLLYELFGSSVNGRGRFIEDQERSIGNGSTGD